MPKAINEQQRAAVIILHGEGWLDKDIVLALGLSAVTVRKWREREGLSANGKRIPIDNAVAFALYEQGKSDAEIARQISADQSTITRWRQKRRLERHRPSTHLTAETKRAARKMLRLGASRRQVADKLGIRGLSTVQLIRNSMDAAGMRETGRTTQDIRDQSLRDPSLYPRIERAIGNDLPEEVRNDAVDELYLAVVEGIVAAEFIETVAKSYRSQAWRNDGKNYRDRSLDAEVAEGWSLADTIEDPSAANEIELAADAALRDQWGG